MRVGQQRTEQQATVHNLVVDYLSSGFSRGGLEDAREGGGLFVVLASCLFVVCLVEHTRRKTRSKTPNKKANIKTLVLHQHQRPESVYKKSESSPVFV